MNFKAYVSDFGFKIGTVKYLYEHVKELTVEDPERNNLTRGSNAGNNDGIVFKEGLREPKKWTVVIMGMSAELKAAMDLAFQDQTRLEAFCIDRTTGSSKMLRKAILANRPQQLTINDSEETLDVSVEFVGFESSEVHKS